MIYDRIFEKTDFSANGPDKGEYENCLFVNCSFSRVDLSGTDFFECRFSYCDFSMAKPVNTAFRDVVFEHCKLLGIPFDRSNGILLSFRFENCSLDFSSFFGMKLKAMHFKNCKLEGVDFRECDLKEAVFENCDLTGAVFENTVLERADFRTAYNFSIDPEINRLRNARFSMQGAAGLLEKYGIILE